MLTTLPENIQIHILTFLTPSEIIGKYIELNKTAATLGRSPQLWDEELPKLYPLPDLLELLPRPPLAERRSKGKVQIARSKGSGKLYAVRTVSLETTNAGKDDGVPTSCLRELSIIAEDLDHPNLLKSYGGWVDGSQLTIVSDYCGQSLFNHLNNNNAQLAPQIVKIYLKQILEGLNALHTRGIMHRNVKSDNIIVCDNTSKPLIKLCDLSTSRVLDLPIGAYTPEDPKERDRSYREQRRLYNRSPEIVLRQPLYGGEIDLWAVGCIFVELVQGTVPFRCESEVGLLMAAFQICGTPPVGLWDRLSNNTSIFLKLPRWEPIDFRAIALTLENPKWKGLGTKSPLLTRYARREECLEMLLSFGSKVGAAGLMLLERLLIVPSCFRVTAQEALMSPYFTGNQTAVTEWMTSYTTLPDVNVPLESRLHTYYKRFVELEQRRYASGINSSRQQALDMIRAMEHRAFHMPERYTAITAIPFNYQVELEKVRKLAAEQEAGHSGGGNISLAASPTVGNGEEAPLTPLPNRRSRLGQRRRRNSSDDDEMTDQANSEFKGQLRHLPSLLTSPASDSTLMCSPACTEGTCCSLWDQDWRNTVDFELDHDCGVRNLMVSCLVPLPAASSSLTEQPSGTATTAADCWNQSSSLSSSDGKSVEKFFIDEDQRKLIALSQSPLNARQLIVSTNERPADPASVLYRRQRIARCPCPRITALDERGQLWISRCAQHHSPHELPPPWLLPRVGPRIRLDIVNFMMGIQPEFLLRSQTLHLAVNLFDRYSCHLVGHPDKFSAADFVPLALSCLKIADLYNEVSKEYYKQDNISEYCDFSLAPGSHFDEIVDSMGKPLKSVVVTPNELLAEEKKVLNLVGFRVLAPTTCWLVDAYLGVARLLHLPHLVDYCHYLADLGLYSHRLLLFRPGLQAQCMMLFACATLYRPNCVKRGVATRPLTTAEHLSALAYLLRHWIAHRNTLCAANTVWEVLDCLAILENLITDGRRLFEALALRSVERLHSWVSRSTANSSMGRLPPKFIKCILPSSQDALLASLDK